MDTTSTEPRRANVDSARLRAPAQTNLQLWAQLMSTEPRFSARDLARLAAAYDLALASFSGHYRASRKPFLCHLVGTASLIAAIGGTTDEIGAALLHSIYTHEALGRERDAGVSEAARARVRAAVGDPCERLVHEYAQLRFNKRFVRAWVDNDEAVAATSKSVLRLRLANALEEYVDGSAGATPNRRGLARFGDDITDGGRRLALVARGLGLEPIAEIFARPPRTYALPDDVASSSTHAFVVRSPAPGPWRRLVSALRRPRA